VRRPYENHWLWSCVFASAIFGEPYRVCISSRIRREAVVKNIRPLVFGIAVFGAIASGYLGLFPTFYQKAPGPAARLRIADGGSIESTPLQVALKKGFFKEEGLAVEIAQFPSGKIALDAIMEGKADICTVAETPIMLEYSKGRRILLIATISDSLWHNRILARKDKGIENPNDLKGKRVARPIGTSADYFLEALLILHRIPKDDVAIIDMAVDKMKGALLNGEVDAISCWSPVVDVPKALAPQFVTFLGLGIYKMTWNLVGTEEFVRKNPQTVRKILRAFLKSEEYVQEHPGESRGIMASVFQFEEGPALRQNWDRRYFYLSLDNNLLLNLEDQARWAIRNRMIDRNTVPNFLDVIYFDGLRAVKPEAVTITFKEE